MYIIKNAIKSISRSKGRNILIGIIVVVIAIASTVSLSIQKAAKTAEETGLNDLAITATIGVDRQKIMESASGTSQQDIRANMQAYKELSLQDLQIYAASEYVESFNYSLSTTVSAGGSLTAYSTTSNTNGSTTNTTLDRPGMTIIGNFSGQVGDFTLTGYNSESAMTDFVSGTSKITSGSIFDVTSSDLKCIISNELAVLNSLNAGDTIILTNPNSTTESYTFTIAGIYTNSSAGTTSSGRMQFSSAQDQANQIYTSSDALGSVVSSSKTISADTALNEQVNGTYVFSSKEQYDSFSTAVYEMGLDNNYSVTSPDVTAFEQSLLPLQNLSKFANTMQMLVLGIGGLILIVFNIYSIRERKYEVGVLTAIGMKKHKVAAQFISEIFLVTIIALIIGISVGTVVSVPTANKLLASQIASQQTQSQQRNSNFGRSSSGSTTTTSPSTTTTPGTTTTAPGGNFRSSVTNYISTINTVTNFSIILDLLGIGILLTLISSSAAVIFILRYEPLKILSERS